MKIYSFIPCLFNEMGHHYSYHLAVEEILKKNKWKDIKFIPRSCKINNLPKHWKKTLILHAGKKKKSFLVNLVKPFLNFFPFLKIFKDIKRNYGKEKQVVFLEYFTIFHFIALSLAACIIRPKCFFWILYRTDLNQIIFRGKIHRILHELMYFFLKKKRFKFFTDSNLLSKQLSAFFKENFHVLPIPHTNNYVNNKKREEFLDKIICWWPGGSIREEKGIKVIKNLSKHINKLNKFHLLIAKSAKKFIYANRNVKFVKTNLSMEEYNKLMLWSDIILLTYSKEAYKRRSSGIFVEAIVVGKITLVTEDTWMASELRKFDLNELIIDFNKENIFSKIEKLQKSREIQKKVKKMSIYYQNFHSIENFAKEIKKFE